MNKISLLLFTLITFTFQGFSQDYFWVGGSGNWTDVSHWATTSGGTSFHSAPPGANNDVYFDANSFDANNQEVTLDADSLLCKNLNFSGVTNSPKFGFEDYYDRIFIHGDFTIVEDMQWGFQQTYLVGENIDINTNNVWIPSTFYISPTNENTNVNLGTDLNLTSLQIQSGNFKTNNFNLELNEMRVGSLGSISSESTAAFGSSQIKTPRFIVHPDRTAINPGTSEIVIEDGTGPATVLFFGGGFTFYDITFIGVVDRIKDNNTFNTFTVMPGSELSFENGETQTANQFIFSGTSAQPISIHSRAEGEAATIKQTSGTVNGNYLILQDNIATGGATFNASNSTNLGNVSGWNIEVTAPENYYWVGNSGNWSDLSHWSKTSGGTANHIDLPTAIDNIYFDANSFSNSTSVVNIDLELIFADNIYTAGTAPGTEIKAANTTKVALAFMVPCNWLKV
ncbi:MAG: hypothetical protein R2728_00625 [Chitinophagales bacterium]